MYYVYYVIWIIGNITYYIFGRQIVLLKRSKCSSNSIHIGSRYVLTTDYNKLNTNVENMNIIFKFEYSIMVASIIEYYLFQHIKINNYNYMHGRK